jgi:hypothetical protein
MLKLWNFIAELIRIKPFKLTKKEDISIPEKLARIAEKEWERNIIEKTHEINLDITAMYDNNGWGRWLRSMDGGECPDGYTRPPDPDWCGHALANHALKMNINKKLCRKVFVSTYRLSRESYWADCNVPFPLVEDSTKVKRGDIVVLRWRNGKQYGDHITVAITDMNDGTFKTVEGNAKGILPGTETGRGLIKQTRKGEQVARIYRLTREHINI